MIFPSIVAARRLVIGRVTDGSEVRLWGFPPQWIVFDFRDM